MQLSPWTLIARPHEDVLTGTFKQAEFAADLSRVKAGSAGVEYQDPEQFFERTFITEGMRLLLDSLVRRLNGQGGDPVIQLQTAFGGGKTHTMLAVYHLASASVPASKLRGISTILDQAGITSLPTASVAIIDGNRQSPSQPQQRGSVLVRTLWGEIAYQIGGEAGYALVAKSDEDGTSPGKEVLIDLLTQFGPVVILMDELVAYMRQFETGKSYSGGTFDSNLSFIQALTEALSATTDSVLFASLPESDAELGSVHGKRALEALEKYFGRIQAIWKPVAAEESFEIVRRRLFNPISDIAAVDAVCTAYSEYYQQNKALFPSDVLEAAYLRKLKNSYPIHPEVFERLYEDWSSLERFQRTRGVLQLLATVVYRLWKDGNADPMIMPGALPLADHNVRNQSISYLPQGWDPVIDRDIDGEGSEAALIDTKDPRIGAQQGARRTARTIFLGSAPSTEGKVVIRGVDTKRILLGAAFPGMQPSIINDALHRLCDRLHYLSREQERYWFDTRPNLRREMEERKGRFETGKLLQEVKERLVRLVNRGQFFAGVHVFADSSDVPDDLELRLYVLPPTKPYSKTSELAFNEAESILKNRGAAQRIYRNRLIFLAPDYDCVSRLLDNAKTYLAWKSIEEDVKAMRLNLDVLQQKNVKEEIENISRALSRMISECYKWLICPSQYGTSRIEWEALRLNPGGTSVIGEVESRLTSEELILTEWAPVHLANMLNDYFWKEDVTELNTHELWTNICSYMYLDRLASKNSLQQAIADGVQFEDYFGYAGSKSDKKYQGFCLGSACPVNVNKDSILIKLDTAKAYRQKLEDRRREEEGTKPSPDPTPVDEKNGSGEQNGDEERGTSTSDIESVKSRFFATIELSPRTGKIKFDDISEEILNLLNDKPGIKIKLTLDIDAELESGFDENTQRALIENCNHLKFTSSEFD